MRAITLKEAEKDLQALVTRVMDDTEPAIVLTESGQQVVLMRLDDYNALQETHYLLASPANTAHLRQSMAEAVAGKAIERSLVDAAIKGRGPLARTSSSAAAFHSSYRSYASGAITPFSFR